MACAAFVRTLTNEMPVQIQATRTALIEQADELRTAAIAEVDKQATLLQMQLAAARRDAMAEIDRQATGLQLQIADARSDAMAEIHGQALLLQAQIGETRRDAVAAITPASDAAVELMNAYAVLPDRFYNSPEWLKVRPEITCLNVDGSGYGGCWHARITAVLGEAANAGGVFTKKFPAFADSTTGIAKDVHTFTSKTVAPRGFWGTFKDFVAAGSGIARAGAAAGLFDTKAARPKMPSRYDHPNPFATTVK